MGNKQSGVSLSGSQQHVAEPTSRSFSWQPDPLFAGEPVKRGESFTGSGVRPGDHAAPNSASATLHRTMPYAASEFGSPGVYRHRQASSPNLATTSGNGSVVRGDAAFGGVQKEFIKPPSKSNAGKSGGNLVNTADSGYMTEIAAQDSDNSARGRLRGSRLSLNDAMLGGADFVQQQPQPQHMMGPPGMPLGPHYMHLPPPPGMIPFGPPPGFGPPPDPFLFPPIMNARGAPVDEKKAKKLRKKQQKNQLSRQSSMLGDMPTPGEFIPPYSMIPGPVIAYGPPHPPPPQMANFRSRSIDNFMAAGLIQPTAMIAPPPPIQAAPHNLPVRRYNSHVDISGVGAGINYPSATLGPGMGTGHSAPPPPDKDRTPPVKKERKYEKRKDQQPGSLRDSLGSSRGRLADAPFGIGKTATGLRTSANIETRNMDDRGEMSESALVHGTHSSENSRQRSEVIYETLKGAQRAMLATSAEINTITVNAEKKEAERTAEKENMLANAVQDSPPPPAPKPVIITPEAKAVLERNARILVEAEREERQEQEQETHVTKEMPSSNEQKKPDTFQTPVISKMVEEMRKVPTPPPPPPMPPTQKEPADKDSRQEETEKKSAQNAEMQDRRRNAERSNEKLVQNDQQSKSISSTEKMTSSNDPDDIESMIEATLNPILPRRKYKRPKDFEPLDAWRGINVQQELVKRQPQRNAIESGNLRDQQSVVEERIQVRLVPSPPSKREQSGAEPIYLEYDERLPEFKKRLIETGSFDIPEADKFHHRSNSQPSAGSRGRLDMSPTRWDMDVDRLPPGPADAHNQQRQGQPQLWRDYVAMEEAAASAAVGHGSVRSRKTVDSNKGSLRRLKDSVASIFRTKSSDQLRPTNAGPPMSTATDDLPPLFNTPAGGRYAPSLTPSTSKIKAGDSSDIDFSWVHDLETRFRLEREQFERELQTLKQKSATLQKNDYMLSPKLHRQHSYQPRNADAEIVREENGYSPSLRGPPPANERATRHNDDHYREKAFSSSIDLSGRGAQTPPPPGRMSAYHSQQALDDHVPSSRLMMDQQSRSKYFGIYDTAPGQAPNGQAELAFRDPYERTFRNELQQLGPANVRKKAALFENESQRVQREMDERNQLLSRQKLQQPLPQQQRSSSAPHRFQQQPYRMGLQSQRSVEADEPIYIPRPDYDETTNEQRRSGGQHHRQNSGSRMVNGHSHPEISNGIDYPSGNGGGRYGNEERLFAPPYMDEPLVVNTTANSGPNARSGFIASPRSPSERRLARFYNSHANVANGSRVPNGGNRYESQPALSSGNPQRYGQYSPSSRSPRMTSRPQQQQPQLQYHESTRTNVQYGRGPANGFDNGPQQPMIKANRMGGPRAASGGQRGVAFANE